MQKLNALISVVLKILLIVCVIAAVYLIYTDFFSQPAHEKPTPPISIFSPSNPLDLAATQMEEAGNPVPTTEYVYIYNRDFTGLQTYLDNQAQNWVNMSMNIHSGNVYGVATSSEKVQSIACTWPVIDQLLCRTAEIEYTAVYKGVITGGVQADFVLHPKVSLKEDWSEIIPPVITGNKIEITYGSTAIITYSGEMCITSVEESTPSSVQETDTPPTDKSYTIKSKDERRLWPDLGPYIFPTGINEEYLRIDAYKKAKDISLVPEKVTTLYSFIEGDMLPGGKYYEAVKSFYTAELATMYRVKGFELVFVPTRGDPLLRCDGTPVNK